MKTKKCLGHITKRQSPEGWCYRCIEDELNVQCPYYREAFCGVLNVIVNNEQVAQERRV